MTPARALLLAAAAVACTAPAATGAPQPTPVAPLSEYRAAEAVAAAE